MSVVIPFEIEAEMPYNLAPEDNFGVEIDISTWLGSDTISGVTYSIKDEDGATVTTSLIIDSGLSTYTDAAVKPYITSGGTVGKSYRLKYLVTANSGDEKAFYLRWVCSD